MRETRVITCVGNGMETCRPRSGSPSERLVPAASGTPFDASSPRIAANGTQGPAEPETAFGPPSRHSGPRPALDRRSSDVCPRMPGSPSYGGAAAFKPWRSAGGRERNAY